MHDPTSFPAHRLVGGGNHINKLGQNISMDCCQQPPPKSVAPVEFCLISLQESFTALHETIDILKTRLDPVLDWPAPPDDCCGEKISEAPRKVRDRLKISISQIDLLNVRLREIIERLDV
jgi:hypothetical protein